MSFCWIKSLGLWKNEKWVDIYWTQGKTLAIFDCTILVGKHSWTPKMYWIGLFVPIHLLVAVSGVVVPDDVDVVVDDPVVPVAKIIKKITTAHVVFSPIFPFTLTLIPQLSIPCVFFCLAHPPLLYSSTVSSLPVPKTIKKKIPQHTCTNTHTVSQSALRNRRSSRCLAAAGAELRLTDIAAHRKFSYLVT